jgi:hypothetical protein
MVLNTNVVGLNLARIVSALRRAELLIKQNG